MSATRRPLLGACPAGIPFRDWLSNLLVGRQGPGLACARRALFFAWLGLFLGTTCDAFHIFTETARYHDTIILPVLNVAWFVPLEFTLAGLTVGMVRPIVDRRFGGPSAWLSPAKAIGGLVFFALAWLGSGLLTPTCLAGSPAAVCTSDPNRMYTALLLVTGAMAWYLCDRTREGIVAALLTAAIGVGLELFLIHVRKNYEYLHPSCCGVPSWLPALYFLACGSIGNFGRFLQQDTASPPGAPAPSS